MYSNSEHERMVWKYRRELANSNQPDEQVFYFGSRTYNIGGILITVPGRNYSMREMMKHIAARTPVGNEFIAAFGKDLLKD